MTPNQSPQASFSTGAAKLGTPLAFSGAASNDPGIGRTKAKPLQLIRR